MYSKQITQKLFFFLIRHSAYPHKKTQDMTAWVQRNSEVASRKHCCKGNAATRSVGTVELHVTVNSIKNYRVLLNNAWMTNWCHENNRTYLGLHVKCPIRLTLINFGSSRHSFIKAPPPPPPRIKFHENPSTGSRADTCWQSDITETGGHFPRLARTRLWRHKFT